MKNLKKIGNLDDRRLAKGQEMTEAALQAYKWLRGFNKDGYNYFKRQFIKSNELKKSLKAHLRRERKNPEIFRPKRKRKG